MAFAPCDANLTSFTPEMFIKADELLIEDFFINSQKSANHQVFQRMINRVNDTVTPDAIRIKKIAKSNPEEYTNAKSHLKTQFNMIWDQNIVLNHLNELQISYTLDKGEIIISTVGESQLNKMAQALSHKHGVKLVYAPNYNYLEAYNGAYYSGKKMIHVDTASILDGKPSPTLLHESRHSYYDKMRIENTPSPFHIKFTTATKDPMSISQSYFNYMSGEELSTWSKNISQIMSGLKTNSLLNNDFLTVFDFRTTNLIHLSYQTDLIIKNVGNKFDQIEQYLISGQGLEFIQGQDPEILNSFTYRNNYLRLKVDYDEVAKDVIFKRSTYVDIFASGTENLNLNTVRAAKANLLKLKDIANKLKTECFRLRELVKTIRETGREKLTKTELNSIVDQANKISNFVLTNHL